MFDRIRGLFRKESRTGKLLLQGNNDAKWSKRNFKAFADEGYQKNVIAFQAINKTANSVAAIPIILSKPDGEALVEHPMLSLINRPNPLQSRVEFITALVGYYQIAGNSFLEKVMVQSMPKELYTLRPDRMGIVESNTGIPAGYKYKLGMDEVNWESDIVTGESDIRHLKTFNPLDDWYGLSPIEAGAYGVDQHNETMKHLQSLLQNGASPSGALEVHADIDLSDDQFNRLKSEVDEKFSGSANAGRPLLLEGGMKWTQMGLSPQAMGILDIKYSSARDISLALGVPPLLLNIQGDSTYSNYKEARLAFYEETVIPLGNYIIDELNVWLEPYLGGLKFSLDLDQVPAIAEKRMTLWEMADKSSDLTINEKREIKGYEPVKDGDTIYITTSMIPLSFDSDDEESEDPEGEGDEAFGDDEESDRE